MFWKNKQPVAPKPPTLWQQVLKRYPVGSEIVYLGVKMVVRRSSDYLDLGEMGWDDGELVCDYVDAFGVVRTATFTHMDANILTKLL